MKQLNQDSPILNVYTVNPINIEELPKFKNTPIAPKL